MSDFASAREVLKECAQTWRPPPRLTLSEWADEHFYLSAESAAVPGRWSTLPYQRGMMDALTDPTIERVSIMKSARVGYTKMIGALIGFHIHHDPCPILVVQPTVEDAKGYSKEEIAPMLRDCPELSRIVFEDSTEEMGPKDSANTILHKRFPGGVLSMVGANSGAGFRRVSRRVVLFDEVDGYPPSAGSDGDPVKLGTKRSEYYHNRKIVHGSTPLIAGHSRIEDLFKQGDQRRFYVPCPQCGHSDYLVWSERDDGGHFMAWPPGEPRKAHFVCSANGCVIEHHQKREMIERGEWRSTKPGAHGHASFHVWAAYSFSPNATWGQLAEEFLESKDDPEKFKTFVNTVLGETWQERGEAPDWQRIYNRREHYPIGSVPDGVKFLTCGVDVQKDRWVYEVVGWGLNRESWSIDAGVIPGDTSRVEAWVALDELLERRFDVNGAPRVIAMLAVDAGYNTQVVYNWGRRHERNRVVAVKGVDKQHTLISVPTAVDVALNGKRIARGYKVWPLGVSVAKSELYGWLRMVQDADGRIPVGWCHFPEHPEEFFRQLTSEHLVTTTDGRGFSKREWQLLPGRENHWLDARVYARAAAAVLGLDRVEPQAEAPAGKPAGDDRAVMLPPAPPPRPQTDFRLRAGRAKGWLKRH